MPSFGKEALWEVHFVRNQPWACTVGPRAFETLKPGDAVEVRMSRIFEKCVGISRDGEAIRIDNPSPAWDALAGGLLLLSGLGVVRRSFLKNG
jgi:hypothetical protein